LIDDIIYDDQVDPSLDEESVLQKNEERPITRKSKQKSLKKVVVKNVSNRSAINY
jgi:hypothetical protein